MANVQLSETASLCGVETSARDHPARVFAFKGIPYAQPPTGNRRLRPPEPLKLWQGQRDASKYGPICHQNTDAMKNIPHKAVIPDEQSEDCLQLNVWTPSLDPSANKAVMVWIHGGGFAGGWSSMYEGVALAAYEDVVFVSINYRCGLLGFLSTGDEVIPGNYGLLDQMEALRWISKYIRKFGGNPDNVTILGQSAGGISCAMLLVSEAAQGLFHRAICQSGTCLIPGMTWSQDTAKGNTLNAMKKLGCESENSEDILKFLQEISIEEITSKLTPADIFRPCVDNKVVASGNIEAFRPSSDIPLMVGCNNGEGALMVHLFCGFKVPNDEVFNNVLRIMAAMGFPSDVTDAILEEYKTEYFEGDSEEDRLRGLTELIGDFVFVYPSMSAAEKYCEGSNTYLYYLDITPSYSPYPEWVGADHAADVSFVQGHMLFDYNHLPSWTFNDEEAELAKVMMKYWANFAKTGNPNGSGLSQWRCYCTAERNHLILKHGIVQGDNLKERRIKFWKYIISKYNGFIVQ